MGYIFPVCLREVFVIQLLQKKQIAF